MSEQLTHMGRVLLLDMSLIVLVIGARAGHLHGPFPSREVAVQVVVEELPALSVSTPRMVKGRLFSISATALQTLCWPRFQDERTSVHPLKISVVVTLQRKLPPMSPPQCATVSASNQPGSRASQHSARIGTRALIAVFALDVRRFVFPCLNFFGPSTRSIWAALMLRTAFRVAPVSSSSCSSLFRFPRARATPYSSRHVPTLPAKLRALGSLPSLTSYASPMQKLVLIGTVMLCRTDAKNLKGRASGTPVRPPGGRARGELLRWAGGGTPRCDPSAHPSQMMQDPG